jgi:hypothetical protein
MPVDVVRWRVDRGFVDGQGLDVAGGLRVNAKDACFLVVDSDNGVHDVLLRSERDERRRGEVVLSLIPRGQWPVKAFCSFDPVFDAQPGVVTSVIRCS